MKSPYLLTVSECQLENGFTICDCVNEVNTSEAISGAEI